jgi:hypothetical protein
MLAFLQSMAYTVEMKRYVDVTLSGTLDERLVGSRCGGGSYDHVVTRRPLRGRGGARERLMEGGIGSFGEAAEATAEAGAACEAAEEGRGERGRGEGERGI